MISRKPAHLHGQLAASGPPPEVQDLTTVLAERSSMQSIFQVVNYEMRSLHDLMEMAYEVTAGMSARLDRFDGLAGVADTISVLGRDIRAVVQAMDVGCD